MADLKGVIVVSTDPRLERMTLPWPRCWPIPSELGPATVTIHGAEVLAAAVPILSNPDQDNRPTRQLGIAIAAQPNLSRWSSLGLGGAHPAHLPGRRDAPGRRRFPPSRPLDQTPDAGHEARRHGGAGRAAGSHLLRHRRGRSGSGHARPDHLRQPLAATLLSLPANSVGQSLDDLGIVGRLRDVLTDTGEHDADEVVIRAGRVLVLNRMPVVHNGRSIGSVTTLRDRTELAKVESELGAFRGTTDLLRAQAHEFGNQLHTISGLIEIGDYDEVVTFVDTLVEKRASLDLAIARRVQDRSVAALLLAKAALAAEKKVTLRVSDRTGLTPLRSESSFDVATVLGNLIDNGIDAVSHRGRT